MDVEKVGRVALDHIYRIQNAKARSRRVLFSNSPHRDLNEITFGFFGELGYALISYIPFLNYLSETTKTPLNTVGGIGTSPFFNFSNHMEVDVISGDGWGSASSAFSAKSHLPKKSILFCPIQNVRRNFCLGTANTKWENPDIHVNMDQINNYKPLDFSATYSRESDDLISKVGKYQVINVKNYYNWGTMDIPNYYSRIEIEALVEKGKSMGYKTLLNRFPSPIEPGNLAVSDLDLSGLADNLFVFDLATVYSKIPSLHSRNEAQIHFLTHASHIYASQGGNAALSLICGQSCSILMRGGGDWPDYMGMSKRYNRTSEICYEIDQMQIK